MKYLSNIPQRWIFLAGLCLIALQGCSRSEKSQQEMSRTEIQAKLNGVLQRMLSQCKDQTEIEQLKAAHLFDGIQGLDMDVVGIRVPNGTNTIHVSFTMEHFRKNTPDVLATEALNNLHRAKDFKWKSPNG
jgi:hypothetical protein